MLLSYCLFTPLSSCLLDSLNDVPPIAAFRTAEVGYETRVSARLRQTFSFYPTVRAPDYDVPLRHCAATHQHDRSCVRRTPSHRLPPPDSVAISFVHELLENVDAISPRGNARLLHARRSVTGTIQARGRIFGHGSPLHRTRHKWRGRPVTLPWVYKPSPL